MITPLTQVNYPLTELSIKRQWLSKSALQVAAILREAGFDGYLVGGCVRDLLLQRCPKDFDIVTNATPHQTKSLFHNSRIIGRRFKLVHVRWGEDMFEVSTYRAKPTDAKAARAHENWQRKNLSRNPHKRAFGRSAFANNGRVVDDNIFGTIEEDAARRDFTINALYYDPEREQVIDFLGGVKDLRENLLRVIGDATERFKEDPVRILRALRFRAKLGLQLDPAIPTAIADCRHLLADIPSARLFDEVVKMFHHKHALVSWRELHLHHLIEQLFQLTTPEISKSVAQVTMKDDSNTHAHGKISPPADLIVRALHNTDQRVREDKPVISAFLFAVLLWHPLCHQLDLQKAAYGTKRANQSPLHQMLWRAEEKVFEAQAVNLMVPRRVMETIVEIWELQFVLAQRPYQAIEDILATRRFRAAYDFFLLRAEVGEADSKVARWWTDIQNYDKVSRIPHIDALWRASKKSTKGTGKSVKHSESSSHTDFSSLLMLIPRTQDKITRYFAPPRARPTESTKSNRKRGSGWRAKAWRRGNRKR